MKWTTSFFRMDSGYESEEIAEVIEEAGYQYVVKAKEYSNMLDKAYDRPVKIWEDSGKDLSNGFIIRNNMIIFQKLAV